MKRFLAAFLFALVAATAAPAQTPLTFTQKVNFGGSRVPIPMELYLTPVSRTRIAVKLAGNLRAVQAALPAELSDVIEDTCDRRVALELDSATAEGDHVRAVGRVQVTLYSCRNPEDITSRRRLISNIAEVNVLLDGKIENNCLRAQLEELTIAPGGFAGGVMGLFNIDRRVSTSVRDDINAELAEKDRCLEMPPALQALNAHVATGGFRDFGEGELGFVLEGTVDLSARGVIRLMGILARRGAL